MSDYWIPTRTYPQVEENFSALIVRIDSTVTKIKKGDLIESDLYQLQNDIDR